MGIAPLIATMVSEVIHHKLKVMRSKILERRRQQRIEQAEYDHLMSNGDWVQDDAAEMTHQSNTKTEARSSDVDESCQEDSNDVLSENHCMPTRLAINNVP